MIQVLLAHHVLLEILEVLVVQLNQVDPEVQQGQLELEDMEMLLVVHNQVLYQLLLAIMPIGCNNSSTREKKN